MEFSVTVIALEYVAGTSDKFYRVFTVGNRMVTQYGRNGTYGTFTAPKAHPDEAQAEAAAQHMCGQKMAKGYQVVKTGAAWFDHDPSESDLDVWASALDTEAPVDVSVPQEREQAPAVAAANTTPGDDSTMNRVGQALGFSTPRPVVAGSPLPMLAHNAPADVAPMLVDPAWVMQPKLDGDRLLVEVIDGQVRAYGRNGQAKVSNVGAAILAPFRGLTSGRFVFDGEVVGRDLWLFDLPVADGFLDPGASFTDRHAALALVVDILDTPRVQLVPVAVGHTDKAAMLADAEAQHKEGVMFRLAAAPYTVGRSDRLLKFKFTKTIDAVVLEAGRKGKDSAALGVYDHDGRLVEIGAASTIGKNKAGGGIKAGQVVEVKFLYLVDPASPRLYQPRIVKVRTDKAAAECSTDQLIGAHTDRTVTAS